MSQQLVSAARPGKPPIEHVSQDYVSIILADQMFGVPVLQVQDVLGPQRITRVPLAPPEIAGSLNLRGRIVTAIDLRRRMRLPPRENGARSMSVVVDFKGELYSLLVDNVGEVLTLSSATFEANPATLDPIWREVSSGIHRLDENLLILIDVAKLLDISVSASA